MFLFLQFALFAQSRTVKGTVKDAKTNETIPGITVLVQGTTIATSTDINGSYSIIVDGEGKKLIFSSVGYVTQTVAADKDVIDISLGSDVTVLKDVVVTAVGISREKKSLGYASQEVKGDAIEGAHEMNVANSLQGKVAGLNIGSSSGGVGASSKITLRGATSLTGNNSPLFVINGIPVDNDFRESRTGSPNYGNPISDLNPDDIESVNVLKGPVAAALYGSKAVNGAIVVTTKSGKGLKGKGSDLQVSYNFGYSMDKVLRLPEFQNKYGQGYYGSDPSKGQAYQAADESWGAPLDGRDYIDYRGNKAKWVPQPNNIKDFFVTGSQMDNALSIASSDDKGAVRISLSSFNQKGTVPNTAFDKYTAGISVNRQLTKRLSTELSVNYSLGQGKNRPGVGYDVYNPLQSLFGWFGRQVDMKEMKDKYNDINPATGLHYSFNEFHNNPYWTLYNNVNEDRRDRIISTLQFKYKLTDWLSANLRGGSDFYTEKRFQEFKTGTIEYAYMKKGGFYDDNAKKAISNIDAMLVANKRFHDKYSVTATLGYNYYRNSYERGQTEVRGLLVPDLYNVSYAAKPPIVTNAIFNKENVGVYGLVSLGYKDFLYLDITSRKDWTSTLTSENRSYFYPSVSGSFIFSEIIKKDWLSFGKLRVGVAKSGNDTDPYSLVSTKQKVEIGLDPAIISNPFNGASYLTQENTFKTKDLKAESGISYEVGTDVRFFNSRVGLDVTYYNTTTSDLLVPVSLPSSSGYASMMVNAGKINNQGVEVMLNLIPIKTESGFTWSSSVNFAQNVSKIVDLYKDLDQILIETSWAQMYLVKGQSYGTLFGPVAQKDENGNYLINPSTGLLIKSDKPESLGNISPDFRLGFDNNFTFKNITLGFLVDWQQGGKVYSQTNMWTDYSGLSLRTEDRPDDGLVMKGVVAQQVNGVWVSTGVENTKKVNAMKYWHDHAFTDYNNNTYDATYVKLRQINLGYSLPQSVISKTPFSNLSFGIYGRNVWIIKSNLPYMDPEVSSNNTKNGSGFESNAIPSSRSFGFNLKAVF